MDIPIRFIRVEIVSFQIESTIDEKIVNVRPIPTFSLEQSTITNGVSYIKS